MASHRAILFNENILAIQGVMASDSIIGKEKKESGVYFDDVTRGTGAL